jgi:integrase
MPALKRYKTKYPGIYYVMGKSIAGKPEKIYYMRYWRNGKLIEEKAGRQYQDDMTPARAAQIRERRVSGKELSNDGKRAAKKKAQTEEANKWSIDRLFNEYFNSRPDNKARAVDKGRYEKYLKPSFGTKESKDFSPLDIDRLRINLLKKLSPQTVKHILNLLTWIINFGVKKNLCEGISFHVQKPTVNNLQTEDLTEAQLKKLLEAIETYHNIQIKNLMKMALYTGMRRGELFKLQWDHIDFERGFINIVDPKGGIDQKIPLNQAARQILDAHPKPAFKAKGSKDEYCLSPFVFPGRDGKQRVSCQSGVNDIKKKAGLPKGFRPMHGLRHVYASMLASSGEVDLYTLQRLLTHKDPRMTQRYAHLRDETLKKASNVAMNIIEKTTTDTDKVNNIANIDISKK